VRRHVRPVAGGGRANPCPPRGPPVHPRHRALLGPPPACRPSPTTTGACPARGASPCASTWPSTSTPDIVAHSHNGFPVRTGEEFLQFLRAAAAFGAGQPEALGTFLAAHPGAKRFVEAPKPIPTSFAREAFFAITSFQFTNAGGVSRHGRFRIRPEEGTAYLSDAQAASKSANFSSRRSISGWQEGRSGSAYSCSWPAPATT